MRLPRSVAALGVALVLAACPSKPEPRPTPRVADPAPAAVEENLGAHHHAIVTSSAEAQRQFDRGLVLTYAFNHDDAIAAFTSAAEADPECAMAWWGIALANGPHINNPVITEEHWSAAWDAVEKARHLTVRASPVERALIRAQWNRYTKTYTTARGPLDERYALHMRQVWDEFRDDPDVGTLFAEALMQTRPWDYWTPEGVAKDEVTEEIVKVLEAVLAKQPTNPGANHLYVHALEGSAQPLRADPAADRLRTLVPDSGHLLHMPSHIDARVGRWAQASETNVLAVAADDRRAARTPKSSFYRLYMAHNRHFLAFSSMMEGRSAAALDAARTLVARYPLEVNDELAPAIDAHLPIALHVLVRFGRWEDVLREPELDERFPVARAVRHYARGVSLAALGRLDEADREAAALDSIAAEIAYRRGKVEDALAALREAVTIQDNLKHDEPPSWMQPVRHVLAATLLDAKKPEEAEKVLLEDLRRLPEDGWALTGLVKCLRARAAPAAEVEAMEKRRAKAWARADVKIGSPCLCLPGQ